MSSPAGSPDAVLNRLVSSVCQLRGDDYERAAALLSEMRAALPQLEQAWERCQPRTLLRCLEQLAGLVGKLQASLQRGGAWADTAELRLLVAARLADRCVPPAVLPDIFQLPMLACVQLILGPGRMALEAYARGAAEHGGGRSSESSGGEGRDKLVDWMEHIRHQLAWQVDAVQRHMSVLAAGLRANAVRAQRLAGPERFLPWLEAAVDAAAALHGDGLGTGESERTLASLCDILVVLRATRCFAAHYEELDSRPQVQSRLARALMVRVRQHAAAAQLPAERQPAGLWKEAQSTFTALVGLQRGVDSLLGEASGSAGTASLQAAADGSSSAAWQLARCAALMLAALPQARPEALTERDEACLALQAANLLENFVYSQGFGLGQRQQRRQLASLLARALQPLPHRLGLLAGSLGEADSAERVGCHLWTWNALAKALNKLCAAEGAAAQRPAASGAAATASAPAAERAAACVAALPAWCEVACGLLQALPALDGLLGAVQAHPGRLIYQTGEPLEKMARTLAESLVCAARDVAGQWEALHTAGSGASTLHSAAEAAEQASGAAAVQAAWQLHSAWCRTAHWLKGSSGGVQALRLLQSSQRLLSLLDGLTASSRLAEQLASESRPASAAGPSQPDERRWLRALQAAHAEAVSLLVLASSQPSHEGDVLSAGTLLRFVATVVGGLRQGSPAQLLGNQALQSCLEQVLGAVGQLPVTLASCWRAALQEDPELFASFPARLLRGAPSSSPVVEAWLVHRGLLDAVFIWLPASDSRRPGLPPGTAAIIASLLDRLGVPLEPQLLAPTADVGSILSLQQELLPAARARATAILEQHSTAEQVAAARLALARIAAARSCANLRCLNLALEGGPAAGQGVGSKRCGGCRVAWYCGTACSHADWKAGHRRSCKQLAAEREQGRQAAGGVQEEGEEGQA